MIDTPAIFISHSSTDKLLAKNLTRLLRLLGSEVWLDADMLKFGDSLTKVIFPALRKVDLLVIFVSEAANRSSWVQREYEFFTDMSGDANRVIPILIENCPVPSYLQDIVYCNFSEGDTLSRSLDAIAEYCHIHDKIKNSTKDRRSILLNEMTKYHTRLLSISNSLEEHGDVTNEDLAALPSIDLPLSIVDTFLWLLGLEHRGSALRAIAHLAVACLDEGKSRADIITYALNQDSLKESEKKHIFIRLTNLSNEEAVLAANKIFVSTCKNDTCYNTFIQKHFDILHNRCYDDLKYYLLEPDRGPYDYMLDSYLYVMERDGSALDLKLRFVKWLTHGRFEEKHTNTPVLYSYLSDECINESSLMSELRSDVEKYVLRLLKSKDMDKVGRGFYHLAAMCEAQYRVRGYFIGKLETLFASAETTDWGRDVKDTLRRYKAALKHLSSEHGIESSIDFYGRSYDWLEFLDSLSETDSLSGYW